MIVCTVQHIQKSFGAETVLEDISFQLEQGAKLGLVGPNGAGKTTLLRILIGELPADAGTARLMQGYTMGYLQQDLALESERSMWDEMLTVYEPVFRMEDRMRVLEHSMGELHENDPAAYTKLTEEYARLTDRFEEAGGFGYRSAILGVLLGLGLTRDLHDLPVSVLSGGQKSRVALAKMLLQKPDILFMDEPTNHLDLDATAWLEGYLRDWKGTLVVVSHDRWFMDAVCKQTAELAFGRLTLYDGNYSSFLSQREERYRLQLKAYQLNQKEIQRHEAIIEQYHAWGREKSVKIARSWEKKLDRIERVERPKDMPTINFQLDISRVSGQDVLLSDQLAMAFDDKQLFSGLNLHLRSGDCAALIGPNGIGKTTLLRIISGQLQPSAGAFMLGAGVEVGYYDQQQENLSLEKTVIDEVWDAYPGLNHTQVRNTLAAFMFRGDDAYKAVNVLSGGEKGRLSLLKLMLGKRNLLLLDEPTNHLDMDSRQVLEEAIRDFPGTVLFVSHDRYFINRVATRIIEMKATEIIQYPGNWEDYLAHQPIQENAAPPSSTQTRTAQVKERRKERESKQMLLSLQKQVADVESEIARTEQSITDIEMKLSSPGDLEASAIAKLSIQHAAEQAHLDDLIHQWETLSLRLSDELSDSAT